MKEHTLAYSLRKAYIDILFLLYFKEHQKQQPRDRGWHWEGISLWFHASHHMQTTAGHICRFVLRTINQLSSAYRDTVCPLRDTQWSYIAEMAMRTRWRSWRSPLAAELMRASLIYVLRNWKYALQRRSYLPGQNHSCCSLTAHSFL